MVDLSVRYVRELGIGIATDSPQPSDPGHVFVVGPRTLSVGRKPASHAKWAIPAHQDSRQFFESLKCP